MASITEVARVNALTVAALEHWKEAFLSAAENVLRNRLRDEESAQEEHTKRLKRQFGRMSLEMDGYDEAMLSYLFFPEKVSDES